MGFKEFDKLEEKINGLVQSVKTLREENRKLRQELQGLKSDTSQRDSERGEIKKKITSLLELIASAEES